MHLSKKIIFLFPFCVFIVNASGAFYGLQYYAIQEQQVVPVRRSTMCNHVPSKRASNTSIVTTPSVVAGSGLQDPFIGKGNNSVSVKNAKLPRVSSWEEDNDGFVPATYIPNTWMQGDSGGVCFNTDDEPISLVDECVIRTQHSGVLRTYDEVLEAMKRSVSRSSKYQHFIPLVELVNGIELLQLKGILRIIDDSEEEEAEAFSKFCFTIIGPLYAKARAEGLENKPVFDEVLYLMQRAANIELPYWSTIVLVIEEGWKRLESFVDFYKMQSVVRNVFEEYDEVFPDVESILTLSSVEISNYFEALLQRILE